VERPFHALSINPKSWSPVSVEIRQQDLDKLVARNLISPEETDDREKIATAIRRALENWHQT
jgi:hypothetical protein